MMGFGFSYPYGGGWGMAFMMLWWALAIVGLFGVVRWAMHLPSRGTDRHQTPFEILKERYAKGEIDRKEYEERKRTLES